MPDNTFYVQVKPEDAAVIVAEHVIKGRPVQRLLYVDPKSKEHMQRFQAHGILPEADPHRPA
jgi:NADP-reducing hydrogenase subunit HndC